MADPIWNLNGKDSCRDCADVGLVLIGTRPEGHGNVDLFAPCPTCIKGSRLEHPREGKPRWRDGYWQGRTPEFEPTPAVGVRLSQQENAMRMRLLLRRHNGDQTANPLVALYQPERERIAALSQAMKRPGLR